MADKGGYPDCHLEQEPSSGFERADSGITASLAGSLAAIRAASLRLTCGGLRSTPSSATSHWYFLMAGGKGKDSEIAASLAGSLAAIHAFRLGGYFSFWLRS